MEEVTMASVDRAALGIMGEEDSSRQGSTLIEMMMALCLEMILVLDQARFDLITL